MEIEIPVLAGGYSDLAKFDFSFKDISVYDIRSAEFGDYLEKLQKGLKNEVYDMVESVTEDINEYNKKYVVVKNNPRENFIQEDINNVWKFLLIIYPSDIQIEHSIQIFYDGGEFQTSSLFSWNRLQTGAYPGEILIASEKDIPEINEFAKAHFDVLKLQNYIGLAIENYLTSYTASHLHYQYIALCTTLECIIDGKQELTYRLRRAIAVLCGRDNFCCNLIYDNISKLYDLRSKIVHGEEYSTEKIEEYMPALKAIVSRTIIELMIHNIGSNKELNKKITELGFGDRNKISNGWKDYELNKNTTIGANWTKLK